MRRNSQFRTCCWLKKCIIRGGTVKWFIMTPPTLITVDAAEARPPRLLVMISAPVVDVKKGDII